VQSFANECENLFEIMEISVEALNQLVLPKLDSFHCYHVDVDSCKCALYEWHEEEHKLLAIALLAQ
jgi:hypothetical protein